MPGTEIDQELKREVSDKMVETRGQDNVAFSMQLDVELFVCGAGGRAVVRNELPGQQQHQGKRCYRKLEEMENADRERERVKMPEK